MKKIKTTEAVQASVNHYFEWDKVLEEAQKEGRSAALDRMVEIADESGMYDLPPMDETNDIVDELRDWADIINRSEGGEVLIFVSGDFMNEAASEIERLRAEIKVLRMAVDSHHNKGYPQ